MSIKRLYMFVIVSRLQLAVAIIMPTRDYAIMDLIGFYCEIVSLLLLRTTAGNGFEGYIRAKAG